MTQLWNTGRRFEGRVALVTGAGGALGSGVALRLAGEGATVALGYRRSHEAAEKHVSTIIEGGGKAHAAQLDVTDAESVRAFVEDVAQRYGRLDVVVNTAGRIDVADAVHFEDADPEDIRKLLDVDVIGTMRVCKASRPYLKADGGGAIVNFSGSYGNGVDRDNLVSSVAVGYCATKGAIRGFTASLARDFAPEIRVNAVSPGAIAANWEDDWDIPAELVQQAIAMTPLKRMGIPEEIAETVLFLASDGGGYITGQVLQVDGGWVMAG
jgi:NAD(P)-dependent dehydrogenase (short-subunit alcohol dehydrogenase family)